MKLGNLIEEIGLCMKEQGFLEYYKHLLQIDFFGLLYADIELEILYKMFNFIEDNFTIGATQ